MKEGVVHWRGRAEKKVQLADLVGDQSPSLEEPPRSKRGGSKGDVGKGAMEKGKDVKVIDGVIQSNTSSLQASEVPFESHWGVGN